jgi:phage tail sheath protein FI
VAQNSELISADLSATIADVTSLTRTTINSTEAVDLDALLEGAAADFTALTGGEDGAMEGDSDWDTNASGLILGSEADGEGIYALNAIVPEVFNLMCLPGAANFEDNSASAGIYQEAYTYCVRNFAFLLVDTPPDVVRGSATNSVQDWVGTLGSAAGPNSALYYPRVSGPDPLNPLSRRTTGASGMAAGLYARTDATRGVWKAPAGTEARIVGGNPIDVMTDRQQGPLNTSGINAIRTFPVYNSVIWGARTLDGADARASEWKYIPVRRLALFIEASLQRGLQWVVFEPNDEPLWASVRLNVGAFMNQLHRQGAFQGASARDAYLVKCDSETTTQADINLGILNVYVGFAPVRPAEFVVIRIQQRFANAA